MKYSRGGNLLRYVCAKNCQNIAWFDKVIAEIKIVQFFYSHGRIIDANSEIGPRHAHFAYSDNELK